VFTVGNFLFSMQRIPTFTLIKKKDLASDLRYDIAKLKS
jgi:hypothetical protein